VVDDDSLIVMDLADMVRDLGHIAVEAHSGLPPAPCSRDCRSWSRPATTTCPRAAPRTWCKSGSPAGRRNSPKSWRWRSPENERPGLGRSRQDHGCGRPPQPFPEVSGLARDNSSAYCADRLRSRPPGDGANPRFDLAAA
jgi:hypothetical protein